MTYICDICETIISSSKNIIKHKNTDKCKYIKNILDKRDKINNEKYNNMKTENDSLKQDILLIKENNIKLNDENVIYL